MLKLTKHSPTPYVRTRMALTGSVRHSELRLSFQAVAAARLAVLMLGRACSPRPTLSAVARRALLHYAAQVEAMSPEERIHEARTVSHASRAWLPDAADRHKADQLLETAEATGEAPLPSLAQVTCAPVGPTPEELDLRVNQLLKTAYPRKYAHLQTA